VRLWAPAPGEAAEHLAGAPEPGPPCLV